MDPTALLQAIFDSPIRHAIVVTDVDGHIHLWNRGAARIFQYRSDEIIGSSARVLFSPDDLAHGVPDQEMAGARRTGCAADFRWHQRKDGSLFWADGMLYPVHTTAGEHLGYVKILRDATQEKVIGDAQTRLALEDSLTGLANRAEFRNRFVDMAASAQRHDSLLLLLLLDLDHFKEVNDRLGHSVGDAVLQQVAQRMRALLRDTDFVARLGGDEFVILQPDVESPDDGGTLAEKLVAALSRPFHVGDRELHIGASIGLGVYPHDAHDLDLLYSKADLALYRAKAAGRNGYRFYTPQMDLSAHRRSQEHRQLRRAVAERAFTLCYQPQVDAASGQVVAIEALLRCTAPFFAGYPTGELVALAAETGRLRRLGLWALTESARQVRQWQLDGWPELGLALNFCRVELDEVRFAPRLLELLARAQLSPTHLAIDISEPQLADGFDPAAIIELHAAGVSITVDDLGTGGLSLKHLFELPITSVKLDTRTLPDLPRDRRSAAIATAITQLSHTLGIDVIAERVEDADQADFLRPLCDSLQGFHIGRPMTAEQMGEWLQAQRAAGSDTSAPLGPGGPRGEGNTPC